MEFVKKMLNLLFVFGVLVFMILGSVLVAVQLYGVLTVDGALAINVSKTLGKPTFIVATVTGLIGFVQGYVNGWSAGD